MSELVVTGAEPFGRYCIVEQKRYFTENERYRAFEPKKEVK